jgi:hypothetical protein
MRTGIVILIGIVVALLRATAGYAAILGTLSGVVEDPQHGAIPLADITVRAQLSSWQERTQTDAAGKFSVGAVPAGEYVVTVRKEGFQTVEQRVIVRSGTVTSLMLALPIGTVSETVEVAANEATVNTKSVTTESLVTRDQIENTPGALRTNSMEFVTQFVPGA